MNEVPDNKEIVNVAHVFDSIQLIFQAFPKLWGNRIVQMLQTFKAKLIQVFPGSIAVRNVKSRQLGNAEFDFYVTALGNFVSILQSFQGIWKKSCHFLLRFHIVLTAFIAHTVCIRQLLACLKA